MTSLTGDRVLILPSDSGKNVVVPVGTVAEGDRCVIMTDTSGKPVVVKLNTLSVGNRVLVVPSNSGKKIIIKSGASYLGGIILMGGFPNNFSNDVWRSTDNGASWTQMTANAEWSARYFHCSVAMPDRSIVLMGGHGASPAFKNDVWRSTDNGASWTQMTASAGWSARDNFGGVVMPGGSIIIMGGWTGSARKNDVWRSDDNGASWTPMTANAEWSARNGHGGVVVPDGSIVVIGGYDGSNLKNDVWRSTDNGASWTQMTASAGWSARFNAGGGVSIRNGGIILMGGYGTSPTFKNDVWRSDDNGASWTQMTASAEWSARSGSSVVIIL